MLIYQVFLEVPFHLTVHHAIQAFLGEPLIDGVLGFTFYFYFIAEHKSHTIVFGAEGFDGVFIAWFLKAKLVARKTQDHQFAGIFQVQCLQLGILRGIAAFGCHVDEQYLFPFELAYLHLFAVNAGEAIIVNVFGLCLVVGFGGFFK